jgi:DNA-binding CsgD family transcriptional regulator
MDKLQQKFPDLSVSSLKLCAFIRMKLSSKQISILLNTEPNSVIKARYRLRLKFGLEKDTGLEEFLNTL